jgi:hypothetical protein
MSTALARPRAGKSLEFAELEPGKGWPGWRCVGVANLSRSDGRGRLEAGSDVFPCDPRPVAFAVDNRFRNGSVRATVTEAGSGVGVVARRTQHAHYYAAIVDSEQQSLLLVRRLGVRLDEIARVPLGAVPSGFRLSLSVSGANPTTLRASVEPGSGTPDQLVAEDSASGLQKGGDPGVLATARTVFPSTGPPELAALGNIHLLPYGVQEGQVVIGSPIGEALLNQIRERSTAVFESIEIRARQRLRRTIPSVVAATTGAPTAHGANLRVSTDVPARVSIAMSGDKSFREATPVAEVTTRRFGSAIIEPPATLPAGKRV